MASQQPSLTRSGTVSPESALFSCLFVLLVGTLLACNIPGIGQAMNEKNEAPNAEALNPPITPSLSAGDVLISDVDHMTLVFVPAGIFLMGADGGDPDERPLHKVLLDAYWIDRTEVTVNMYRHCMLAGKCTSPAVGLSGNLPVDNTTSANGNHPVVYVNWNQAADYCAWAGRRLPSEAEWEKAARGTEGYLHPWGNTEPDSSLSNFNDVVGRTTAVGSYPAGSSPYGALDLEGNVIEWVNDCYDSAYYRYSERDNPHGPPNCSSAYRVQRGGAAWDDPGFGPVSITDRHHGPPEEVSNTLGFRCALSP